jgi:hypothetical protein
MLQKAADGRYHMEGELGEHISSFAARIQTALALDVEEKHKKYLESPECAATLLKQEKEAKRLAMEAGALMEEAKTMDWRDMAVVLGWLAKIQPYTDHVDLEEFHEEVHSLLKSHGFAANVNLEKKFQENNPRNYAEYIIGQAMDGLERIGAMHPTVQTFVERWRAKFIVPGQGTKILFSL